MKIDKDSYGSVLGVVGGAAAAVALIMTLMPLKWPAFILSLIAVWFAVFVTFFFRVPRRTGPGNGSTVTSVADGEVVIIEKAYEPEYLKREAIQVSVYMNFFDMHANFWPVDGEVTYYKYHPGKHFLAFLPKASLDNEHTCTCIKTPSGQEVFFKQIAGGFARRIVNYAEKTPTVKAGDQCGIIKFGSRIDMFLPLDADIKVQLGQVTSAVKTVIAQLQ